VCPLNAYGPLFNVLAGLAWLNPLAPKLLFAYGYVLFAIGLIEGFMARRVPSGLEALGLAALFWNPFPWIEIAVQGHFDVLVGLFCLASLRARARDHDVLAGAFLALGVLLKYLPVVLPPFLALDRGRARPRLLIAAMTSIALGLLLSGGLWGLSTLRPLEYAAMRSSTTLSIFKYLRGRYSPIPLLGGSRNYDGLATPLMLIALVCAWRWARRRGPNVGASAVVAVATTLLFYRVGYPQYQMVPFMIAASWAVRNWERLPARRALTIALTCQFGWLAIFDVYYILAFDGASALHWYVASELVGLPAFLFGCVFVAGIAWSATRKEGLSENA